MKIAILLGQSEYQNIEKLPACKNDLTIMCDLIEAMDTFDHAIAIGDEFNTAISAKEEIINFVELYKDNEIDELFFYFTGHGYFDGKEFFYIWDDFDQEKKRQTSLQNSEIDDLLRQLKPKLLVKVIDACNSGVYPIKETESIEYFLYHSKETFNKCYFFFSSQNDQYSLANSFYSIFTSLFIQSISRDENKKIRYKDIIDFISDSFEKIGKQTPLFITQADFTETFCVVNNNINKVLSDFKQNRKFNYFNKQVMSLLASSIKIDAEKYVDFETASDCLMCGLESAKSFIIDSELEGCYEKEVIIHNSYDYIPKIGTIASWMSNSDNELYVNIIYEQEKYDENFPINIVASLNANNLFTKDDENLYKPTIKYKKVPKYFENKFDVPYVAILITLKSKFPNILNYSFVIVPVLSRTKIFYFYSKLNYNRIDWDDQEVDVSSVNWGLETFNFDCSEIKAKMNKLIHEKFVSVIIDELNSRFNIHKQQNETE